jgi:hypothetical protein
MTAQQSHASPHMADAAGVIGSIKSDKKYATLLHIDNLRNLLRARFVIL